MTESPLQRIAFRPVRSGNMYEETIERILQAIALGVLQPGQQLPPERELASLLNISRVTLRDALRSLQESGYVESRPGRHGGTFVLRTRPKSAGRRVPLPTAEQAQGYLDMRWIIERGACEFAAARQLSQEQQATLKAVLSDCSKATRGNYRQCDSRLHLTIAELSGVPSVAALVAENRDKLNRLLDSFPLLPPNLSHSNRQHEQIVDAIALGDAAGAVAAMEQHMRGTAALIHGFLA